MARSPKPAPKIDGAATPIAYLYTLSDPETGEVRYVGRSIAPWQRRKDHVEGGNDSASPVDLWTRAMRVRGTPARFQIVRVLPEEDWREAERVLILRHIEAGARLLNLNHHARTQRRARIVAGWARPTRSKYGDHRHRMVAVLECGHLRYFPRGGVGYRNCITCYACAGVDVAV